MAAEVLTYDTGMTADQRCDRCGAQAFMKVVMLEGKGILLFCAHHAGEHEHKLIALNAVIADHRSSLTPAVA